MKRHTQNVPPAWRALSIRPPNAIRRAVQPLENTGTRAATFTVTLSAAKGDRKREANETFYLDLFGLSSNAQFTKSRGIGTILNDD